MRCPFCRDLDNRVVDSRLGKEEDAIRRRRECNRCGRRFSTLEVADIALPGVVKKDGRRQPFDRARIVAGVTRACEKRPISRDRIAELAAKVERVMQESGDSEITSERIGEAVMRELHDLDAVAYVRFASVYRSFGDADDFMRALRDLMARQQGGGSRRKTTRAPAISRRRRG